MAMILAGPACAGDWRVLSGAEVTQALTGRTLDYKTATQDFRASGKTLYKSAEPSWGNWAVRGDQYCSEWPPADGWACYDVAVSQDGQHLRFIGAGGDVTDGVYRD